jgi:plasmid stabilization system protein ParE
LTQAERIAKDDPSAAAYVVRTIRNAAAKLDLFPNRGHQGRAPGTVELVLTAMPYVEGDDATLNR